MGFFCHRFAHPLISSSSAFCVVSAFTSLRLLSPLFTLPRANSFAYFFFFCSARRHVWWYSFYLCILCAEVGDVGRSTDAAISCILWRDTNKLREKWKTARERKKLVTKCTADPNTKTGQNSTQEGARRIMQSHVMRSNSWLNGNLHFCFFVVSWQFERKIEWNAINRWIGVAWTKMAGVGWHRTKWRSLFFKKKEMKRRRIYGWI